MRRRALLEIRLLLQLAAIPGGMPRRVAAHRRNIAQAMIETKGRQGKAVYMKMNFIFIDFFTDLVHIVVATAIPEQWKRRR